MREGAIALLSLAVVAGAFGSWLLLRKKPNPSEKERLRRLIIHKQGRMADGAITDVTGDTIFYSYKVRGLEYMASQDITDIRDRVPQDISRIIGPVTAKYLPAKPVESIVVCEEWSGIRG